MAQNKYPKLPPGAFKAVEHSGSTYCFTTEAQEDPEKYRFQVELEFVQCLANPQYLNCKFTARCHMVRLHSSSSWAERPFQGEGIC